MSSYARTLSYFFQLPWRIQWRTFLVQLPRFVPLGILHITSPKGPQPFVIALPSRKDASIPIYIFVPPTPVAKPTDIESNLEDPVYNGEWKVPVVLDFHGGGFIMGSPLEQAPYAAMMSRELGAIVISVSYRIGPFHQFPAAIHDAEDVLSAILDTDQVSKASKVLRTEIQRYWDTMRRVNKKKEVPVAHVEDIETLTLDPTRLAISGFSAGGNIALNMAIWVPPCAEMLPMSTRMRTTTSRYSERSASLSPSPTQATTLQQTVSPTDTISPLLPPVRSPTVLDDPFQPWPSLLPPQQAQPRMLPLLLFYPSLDARLLPHERPMKPLPSALNPDDKTPQKQRMPGLFSIMGPTYLPKKLRAHPRASPGLVHPDNIQKNAAMFLVLPEKDSLAVQSDVWVDRLNSSGWNGPVRFGDGRDNDWDGHSSGPTYAKSPTNGGLEVWHAPGSRHGWTQFPTAWLGKHEKLERKKVFARTLDFVRENWAKCLPTAELGNMEQELRPLQIPRKPVGTEGKAGG